MVTDFGEVTSKEVVGVVGDTRHHDLARDPEPEIYRPASQTYWPFFGLVVRTPATPEGFERTLREAAARVDASVPVNNVQSLSRLADKTWAWRRSSMLLLGMLCRRRVCARVRRRLRRDGVRRLGAIPRDRRPRRARSEAL